MNRRAVGLAALLLAVSACDKNRDATLLVIVTASGSPPGVVALDVTLTGPAGTWSNRYTRGGGEPILFPTTLAAELPVYATGDLTIEVHAEDAAGAIVAMGNGGPIPVRPGQSQTVYVRLDCDGRPCVVDIGNGGPDGGMPTPSPRCGNGRIDPGETCDTAIAAGDPGACPATCDDRVPCTRDTRTGSNCTVVCAHDEIRPPEMGPNLLGDGCCPAGASYPGDTDCSPTCKNGVVDPGETCDTLIPAGTAGACPRASDCTSGTTCAIGMLISAGNCSAVCVRYPIVTQSGKDSDTCCPPGATNAVDDDCPKACGNGVVEITAGESCDVGIPPLAPGACPISCEDGDACTIDYFATGGCQPSCQHFQITTPVAGDGCCPEGATNATDTDCPPVCGNGVVERGEACDGDCPGSCPPTLAPSDCLVAELVGLTDDCSARCVLSEVTTCGRQKDGRTKPDPLTTEERPSDKCCPVGCTSVDDVDCSHRCGNGGLNPTLGEICDIAVPPNDLAACETECLDTNPCTEDLLLSAGTCNATCVHLPITTFRPGDGCCALGAGANFALDPDCAPFCGNGVVEPPVERCDFLAGCPGADACPAGAACTRYVVQGSAPTCSAACVAVQVTTCMDGDDCCPAGCTPATDTDCQVICGDGVVQNGESCDRAITAGNPGACERTCNDGNACTQDLASGSTEGCTRACVHPLITGCTSDDGCCPIGCSPDNDHDCGPTCGDGRIGAGETCDPPSTCPTTCPDDGDPCTTERLLGDAATCSTACRHIPITQCSGPIGDACCPTGCTPTSDWDC